MKLLIFRTDIKTKKKVKIATSIFNFSPNWWIDVGDIDNVLRIEASGEEKDIMNLMRTCGLDLNAGAKFQQIKKIIFMRLKKLFS